MVTNAPKLTVLMSVFNTPPPMLERSVASILKQSPDLGMPDVEFLILDDGSTDVATRTYLAEAAAHDSRIRLYFEPHRGLTPALNRGLDLARGALIARQDADDWSEPDRLKRQASYLAAHPETGLLGSAAFTHQADETALWPVYMPETQAQIFAAFERGNPFVHGSVMFRTAAARAVGGYREELRYAQDYDFFWRLSEAAGAANLPDPLYHYRYSAQSVSASKAFEQARAQRAARLLAQARRRGDPEDIAHALGSAASLGEGRGSVRASLKQADHLMLAGDYARAGSAYWALARSRPSSLLAWAKLARLALFSLAPKARPLCFR